MKKIQLIALLTVAVGAVAMGTTGCKGDSKEVASGQGPHWRFTTDQVFSIRAPQNDMVLRAKDGALVIPIRAIRLADRIGLDSKARFPYGEYHHPLIDKVAIAIRDNVMTCRFSLWGDETFLGLQTLGDGDDVSAVSVPEHRRISDATFERLVGACRAKFASEPEVNEGFSVRFALDGGRGGSVVLERLAMFDDGSSTPKQVPTITVCEDVKPCDGACQARCRYACQAILEDRTWKTYSEGEPVRD